MSHHHLKTSLLLSLWCCLCMLPQICRAAGRYGALMAPLANHERDPSLLSFNSTWHVLGPFQIGTRGMLNIAISSRAMCRGMTC
jgi:hypothetical protein